MAENESPLRKLRPQFEDVQAHYDLSDDFFGLFQDPSRTYRFIGKEIFPGGQLPAVPDIVEPSRDAGLSLGTTQLMNQHYVRTLDTWAANLEEHRDDAIATTSEEVYNRYRRYLTGCADFFRRGLTEVAQFEFAKQ